MMNKKIKVVFIIILIITIFQSILLLLLEKKLGEVSENEQAHYNDVLQNVLNLESKIQDTMNSELSKTHLTQEVSFKYDKSIKNGYTLNVNAELARVDNSSKVIFLYKENNSNEWKEIEMKNTGALSYSCTIDLLSDKDYKYKVTTLGTSNESSDIQEITKDEYMPTPPMITGYGQDYDDLNVIVAKDFADDKNFDFKIKKIEAIVKANGKEKVYLFKKAEKSVSEQYGSLSSDNINYDVNIKGKDYKGNLEYIKLKVTYDNGLVDIRDVTSEIDSEYFE